MASGSGLFAHNKQNAWFFSYFTPPSALVKLAKVMQCYTHSTANYKGPYVLHNIYLSVQIFI